MRVRCLMAALVMLSAAPLAAETISYKYDAKGRLVQVVHSGGPANGAAVTYTHDRADNRTRVVVTGAP